MGETNAINRALRAAMHIKGTYSLQELQKPFVVAYLVPNLNNELVKQEAVRHFFTSAQELYGGHNTEGSRKAIFVEDDVEAGMEYETPGQPIAEPENSAYREVPQEPPRQTQERQQRAEETAPDYDPNGCSECGAKRHNGVRRYSQRQLGRRLAWARRRQQG